MANEKSALEEKDCKNNFDFFSQKVLTNGKMRGKLYLALRDIEC